MNGVEESLRKVSFFSLISGWHYLRATRDESQKVSFFSCSVNTHFFMSVYYFLRSSYHNATLKLIGFIHGRIIGWVPEGILLWFVPWEILLILKILTVLEELGLLMKRFMKV